MQKIKPNNKLVSIVFLWLLSASTAHAAIIDPAVLFPQLKTFIGQGATILSVILGVSLFFVIAWHPIKDLIDIRNERKDYGHLVAGIVAAGVVAVLVGYYIQQGLAQLT